MVKNVLIVGNLEDSQLNWTKCSRSRLALPLSFPLVWGEPSLCSEICNKHFFSSGKNKTCCIGGKNVPLFRRECDNALGERRFISELTLLAQLWERRSVTSVNLLSDLTKVHACSDIRKVAEVRCLEHLTPQKRRKTHTHTPKKTKTKT